MKRTTERLSQLELAILAVLAGQSTTGYEIRKIFSDTPVRYFSSSPGAIYPALRRLEKLDLLHGKVEKADTLRPRKVYQVTECGQLRLTEHVCQPVTLEDVSLRMAELVLRFNLLGHLGDSEACNRFLDQLEEHLETHIQTIKKDLRDGRDRKSVHDRLSTEYGLEIYQATGRWLRRARKAIEECGDEK